MGEITALPQSTTNDRVNNKICYFHMNIFANDGIKKPQKKRVQNVTSILNSLEIACCCCCLSVPCRLLLFRHFGPPHHVFNQMTDNGNIYHSEATTLKPKACTMKYTKT